jgi:hypothetical protein
MSDDMEQRVGEIVGEIGDDLEEYAWRIAEQQAEIKRLQEALEQIANPPPPSPFGAPRWVGNPLQDIARTALAGKED